MSIPWEHVSGNRSNHEVRLFALSTCGWCRKTKQLMEELGIDYDRVDVDLLEGEERDEAVQELSRWNSAKTFPTIVIDGEKAIVGYEVDVIRKDLG